MRFFQVGKLYRVITHRPDTHHAEHYFEVGSIVKCVSVEIVGSVHSLTRGNLAGEFVDSTGFNQALYTGDVVKL